MSNVTVAKVDKIQKVENVSIRHFVETDYSDLAGFVFHTDWNGTPLVTFMHKNGREEVHNFNDLAFVAFED